jgi:hypothetical protein
MTAKLGLSRHRKDEMKIIENKTLWIISRIWIWEGRNKRGWINSIRRRLILCTFLRILLVIRWLRMRWVGHKIRMGEMAEMGEMGDAYKIVAWNPERKRPLWRPGRRRIYLNWMRGMNFFYKSEDRAQWRVTGITEVNPQVHKMWCIWGRVSK